MTHGLITKIKIQLGLLATCIAIAASQGAYADVDETIIYSQYADLSEIEDGYYQNELSYNAEDFVLEGEQTITAIEVLGFQVSPVEDSSFRIRIYNDSGNLLPGTLYAIPTIVSPSRTFVGVKFGYDSHRYRLPIEPLTLPAGRYWISIESLTESGVWAWGCGPYTAGMSSIFSNGLWKVHQAPFSLTIEGAAQDTTAPRVSSVTRLNPVVESTNADSLTFRVTFTEEVSNIDTTDFSVVGVSAVVSSVIQTGSTVYDVTVSGGSIGDHNGAVALEVSTTSDIADAAGNLLVDPSPISGVEMYLLDNNGPMVSIALDGGNSVTTTGPVFWKLDFSEAQHIALNSNHILPVTTGSVSASWTYGYGGAYYVIAYGISGTGSISFRLAAGTAVDEAGNTAPASALAPVVMVSNGISDSVGNMLVDGTPTGVSEGYTVVFNQAPSAPSLLGPVAFDGDPAKTGRTLSREPVLTWEVPNDEDGDELHFTVQINTGAGFITVADSAVDDTRFTLMFNPNQAFPAVEGEGMVMYRVRPGILYPVGGGAYNWRVIARDAVSSSSYSEMRGMVIERRPDDLENATAGDHRIRLSFLHGLRREVNLTRLFYGLQPYNFSDSDIVANESLVRAVHVNELREALEELPMFWGFPAVFNQDVDAHKSSIRAEDFIEIRDLLEGHQAQEDNVL